MPQTRRIFVEDPSNWVACSPLLSGFTVGNGTTSSFFRRVGDSMELSVEVTFGSTSTWTGDFEFGIPNGEVMDETKLVPSATQIVGTALGFVSGGANYIGTVAFVNSTTVFCAGPSTTDVWSPAIPSNWNSASFMSIRIVVPIVGWDANQ